ncbi:hypothetical protein CcaverHIS002_0604050 [Cutaneotrichosporon cavernicola]|uniref:Uncharacterized protein n=1 Tax=Cutaneotrichosporon cavernicola TaxID=279322 RepID=A0AA48L862_9TREE|nr:uncharacterized protein CcaverHIS019_0603500 [Cutaneotrichosporon cavernicola]BEI86118.1 hypothetical protein CcaverHIS002_0604050 [Cutaneotrichosporon cavernicola]BEI93891.1 hypothetical protein CcaverHIS019_0603500 [Cutaneotrichosporon cavernicola]BEJ01669.1 hypothetical protein CcaverHIS631_0603510 [Cutaneotrichosporon cavernicola]
MTGSTDPNNDRWWPPFDEVWQAAAGAGNAIAALASSPFSGVACAHQADVPSPPAGASRAVRSFATEPLPSPPPSSTPPLRPASPAPVAPAVPGGFVGLAAAHPYSTAFLMGAMLTGSCLAGAAAANYGFKRGVGRVPQIARPGSGSDVHLARLEELLRDLQKNQSQLVLAQRAAAAKDAAKDKEAGAPNQDLAPLIAQVGEGILPLATQIGELDYKVAAGAGMQRKILATLDSVRETQRNELLILRQEVQDRLVESARTLDAANEKLRQSQKSMTGALRDSVKADMKQVLQRLEELEGRRNATDVTATSPAKDVAAEATLQPKLESEPQPEPLTVMDINVEGSIAQLSEVAKASESSDELGSDDIRAAINAMIAEVKAAEPQLTERLGAASAEWMMIKAVKAAEPYLSSEGPGSAAAKLLLAVKAAEPFASRRMDAAAAVWKIVLTVKEAEPHLQHSKHIGPAEYEILRAIKAAEPYLVQDIDMGGAASKFLRAVKAAEPRQPRFGSERAETQILKTAKWSEPVLRKHAEVMAEGACASKSQDKPLPVQPASPPVAPPAASSAARGAAEPQSQSPKTAPRRRPSNQPVRYLGVNESGDWHFTLLAPLEAAGDGMHIQSREIMLSHESHRSWAGELLSLWHSSHESTCWSVGPFTTALLLNPDVDMVVLDGAWWRCSSDGDVYTVREKVADDAD